MTPTRWYLGVTLTIALATTNLSAQINRSAIYSNPEIPSPEALRRLNLHLAWREAVPMDGKRDALIYVEYHGKDLLAATRSGMVTRIDAETGKVHWRTRVGKPYTILPFLAANSRSVYVIANAQMIALDRGSGGQKWDYPLPAGISAAPVVDEEQIYLPTATTRLYAFYLPFVTLGADGGSPGEGRRESLVYSRSDPDERIRPRPIWSDLTTLQLAFRPVQTSEEVMVVSPSGEGIGFTKVPREGEASSQLYRFSLDGKISAPPGSFGEMAYIGSDDAALYALNMRSGKLRWRHTAGTAVRRQPVALEKDLFVTSAREGMARIDRATGESMWKLPQGRAVVDSNLEADRFLAANDRFVYANDFSGRLLVLDRKRGIKHSMLDTTAFRVTIVNDITDRLYLAANNGLIVCLHDRDQKEPIRHRRILEEMSSPLIKRLNQNVNEPGGKDLSIREQLALLRKNYGLHFVVASPAFKAAKLADPQDKIIPMPRTENKPLKEHLQKILNPANATFQIVDQTVLIIPGKGAK
jgi:outer membrane protein assembly factor BamB